MPDRDARKSKPSAKNRSAAAAPGEAPAAAGGVSSDTGAGQPGGAPIGEAPTGEVQEAGARTGTGRGTPEDGAGVPRGASEAGADDGGLADDGGSAEDGEAPVFLNRAARRARGKGGTAPHQTTSRGANPPGRGPAQGRRQWGNRRTGG